MDHEQMMGEQPEDTMQSSESSNTENETQVSFEEGATDSAEDDAGEGPTSTPEDESASKDEQEKDSGEERIRREQAAVNAANAERRREAERRRAEERERIRRETILEVTGGINPYTNEPMTDDTDVQEYLEMREIERQGGEPVGDFAKYHKQFERQRTEEAEKERQLGEQRARLVADREAFTQAHPDVNLTSLLREDAFVNYAAGRLGKDSLSEIYDDYMKKQTEAKAAEDARVEERARELAAQMVANASASPGSAVGAPQTPPETFTTDQLKRMSREEIRKNYDKIAKSYWK